MDIPLKLFCNSVCYFDGQLKYFQVNEQQTLELKTPINDKVLPILIVSREYYAENVHTYPIESKSELNKLLNLEFPEEWEKFKLGSFDEGKTNVNTWSFSDEIPNALVTIPVSILLSRLASKGEIIELLLSPPTLVTKNREAIYSTQISGVIQSPSLFVMSIGLSDNHQMHKICEDEFPNALFRSMKKLPIKYWSIFLNTRKVVNDKFLTYKVTFPIIFTLTCYLFFTSLLVYWDGIKLDKTLKKNENNIVQTLNIQQRYTEDLQAYKVLSRFVQTQYLSSPLWFVVAEFFNHSQVKNIREINGRVVIRGSTTKATELLERITNLPMVSDAKFDFPTRTTNGNDNFVIGFTLTSYDNAQFLSQLASDLNESSEENGQVEQPLQNESNNG